MEETMFSKVGRMCEKKMRILQGKKRILSGKQPKYDIKVAKSKRRIQIETPVQSLHKGIDKSPNYDSNQISTNELVQSSSSKSKYSAAFRSQSRDQYYKGNNPKPQGPPCGIYNPRFLVVDRNIPTPIFKKHKSRRKSHNHTDSETPELSRPATSTRINRARKFENYPSRDDIYKDFPSPHDSRFLSYNCFPEHISNYKRPSTPSIEKIIGREKRNQIRVPSPSYNVNWKLVEKRQGEVVFDKYTPRQPIVMNYNDLSYDNINFSMIEKRIHQVDFTRSLSREHKRNISDNTLLDLSMNK